MTTNRGKSLTPAKSGTIHSTLKPSKLGTVEVPDDNGEVKLVRANRATRRRILRETRQRQSRNR